MPDVLQGLAAHAAAEQAAGGESCGHVQDLVPENVCVRVHGHDGPHVAHDGEQFLQFAS